MRQVGEQANRHNPWPLYTQLRRDRVVPLGEGRYALGRYDDVLALLHDPRVSSDPHTLTDPGDRLVADTLPFIDQDPPGHDRMRREATRFFGPPDSPGLVTGQEPEIDRLIGTLIDAFPDSGEIDVVDHFAYPLPVAVICRLLGVRRPTSRSSRAGPTLPSAELTPRTWKTASRRPSAAERGCSLCSATWASWSKAPGPPGRLDAVRPRQRPQVRSHERD
jgi:cytochrome P450